jgi:glycerophosphoryl diester phosphodiesterase
MQCQGLPAGLPWASDNILLRKFLENKNLAAGPQVRWKVESVESSWGGEKEFMLVIAHRGASGHAPENTLAAFRKAVAQGATFIETDLQLSRDAHFVAIHDATVNRTSNGTGAVHDLALAQIRQLDAGAWFGSEFVGERIPTLEEILQFSKKNDVVFYLELKPQGSWGGEHALIGALRDTGEIARAAVISFDASVVLKLRKIEPTLMTGLLYDGQIENPIEKAVEVGARQLVARGDLVTPALLEQARKKDLQIVCWTVNHPAHMRMLIAAGVAGIMSDYPDQLVAAVKKESQPVSP